MAIQVSPLERNAAIPAELKNARQWAIWKTSDARKNPCNLDGTWMEWSVEENKLTFEEVARYPYIETFITLESGIIGIDFDGCIDQNGEIHPLVKSWLGSTYAEISPSETGIKMWVRGSLPNDKAIINKMVPWGIPGKHTGIEVYADGRPFTVTGNLIPGCPSVITEAPEVLNNIISLFTPIKKGPKKGYWTLAEWKAWVSQHLEVIEEYEDCFDIVCPWKNLHTTPGDSMRIWYGPPHTVNCFHAHCKGRTWEDIHPKDQWAQYNPSQDHSSNGNGNGSKPPETNQQPDFETIIQRLGENEYGDGLLFAQVFNGLVCYDHSEKAWYLWNKHHWKKDVTGKIKRLVSGHLGSIYLKARGDVHKQIVDNQAEIEQRQIANKEDEKLPKLNERMKYLGDLMEALEKRARALRGATRMKNVLTFAMSEHNIGITGEMWDTDPWLIAVGNGVIDLRTGQLRDGYPIDYIRSVSPTEWTGLDTPCPRFERFLQEIFEVLPGKQLQKLTNGNFDELPKEEQERISAEHRKKLIDFLQRLFGYALAGLSTEAIFPIFYGEEGRNGKDTLFRLLRSVLGTAIANAVHNDVFLSADKGHSAGAATPHLADLQGKRIVWGSETKQGDRINVSQIKQLTGGGAIPARPPYGQLYTFDPTHTLFLMTNYKPHADAKDKAFWSRACLIEFCLRFVDKPQAKNERKADTSLSKDLEAEASGILAMLVRGCLEYQEQGLNRPEIVEMATESYRASEDTIQQFIDDCCVCDDKVYAGAKRLYETYVTWCKGNNINHINGRLFGEDMSKRFIRVHKRTGWEYQKIGILTENTPPESPKRDGHSSQCDGSKEHPSHPSEPAPDVDLDTTEIVDCDGCDGQNQEVPHSTPREDANLPLYGFTRHTRHTSNVEDTKKRHVEPIDSIVTGQDSPVTDEFHPSQQAAIPDDFTFEEKECQQCGCGIYHARYGVSSCARCNPPKGYNTYNHLIDEMYPRKPLGGRIA